MFAWLKRLFRTSAPESFVVRDLNGVARICHASSRHISGMVDGPFDLDIAQKLAAEWNKGPATKITQVGK